ESGAQGSRGAPTPAARAARRSRIALSPATAATVSTPEESPAVPTATMARASRWRRTADASAVIRATVIAVIRAAPMSCRDRRGGARGYFDVLPRRSEEHTSELQSRENLVCRLLLEKKKY